MGRMAVRASTGGRAMQRSRLRVLIVDDHDVVRLGLCTAIGKRYGIVGHCATAVEGLELVSRARPDVVLVDFRLPDSTGDELCRRIRDTYPETSVVVVTAYLSEETVRLAVQAGAAAYVTKAAGLRELLNVLEAIERGVVPAELESVAQIVARLHSVAAPVDAPRLSPHQESILDLAAQGLTNQEISRRLFISESTVRFHMQKMKKAFGARSKTDLVVRAMRVGAIAPAPEGVGVG